jgi:hypothetical protein
MAFWNQLEEAYIMSSQTSQPPNAQSIDETASRALYQEELAGLFAGRI